MWHLGETGTTRLDNAFLEKFMGCAPSQFRRNKWSFSTWVLILQLIGDDLILTAIKSILYL